MSDAMEKWKQERSKMSTGQQSSRVREVHLEKSQSKQVNQKETKSLNRNEGKKSQRESIPLSESLDVFHSKVRENEAIIQLKEKEKNELAKSCTRQTQNICECRYAVKLSSNKLTNDVNLKEAYLTKYSKAFQMFHKLYCNTKGVTDSLQQVEAISGTFGPYLQELKAKLAGMNNYLNESTIGTLPSYNNYLIMLEREQKQLEDNNIGVQKWLNSLQQQCNNENKSKREEDSKDIKFTHDLHSKVLEDKKLLQNLSNCSEKNHREKNEQKQSLLTKLETVKDKCEMAGNDIECIHQEYELTNSEDHSIQDKISESKKRVDQFQNIIEEFQRKTDELLESLSQVETKKKDIESQLLLERDTNRTLNDEIEDTRKQLSEENNSSDQHIKKFTEALLKEKTASAERKQSLQEALDMAKLKGSDILQEEGNLQSDLLQLQSELDTIIINKNQISQLNSCLENDLTTNDCEIQHLTKEVEGRRKSIDKEIHTTEDLEQCLTASKRHLDTAQSEHAHNLILLTEEESCAAKELEAVETREQELLSKIQMLQNEMAEAHSLTIEQHSNNLAECEEKIVRLKGEVVTESKKKEMEINTFQKKTENINGNIIKTDALITSLQKSISEKDQTLNSIEITLQKKIEAKERKEGIVEKCKQDIIRCEENIKECKKNEEEMMLKIQELDLKMKNVDQTIDELNLAQKDKSALILSTSEDHSKEKEVLLQDLLSMKATSEYCADEIKLLRKQLISWNEKIVKIKGESEKVSAEVVSLSSDLKCARSLANNLNRQKQEHLERESILAKETKQAKIEAALFKKKYARLQIKFDAHFELIAQKKEAAAKMSENTTQVAAATGEVTPKFSSTNQCPGENTAGKDDTPKSILKTPSKSPTPQSKKRVQFVDDMHEPPSSGSSIMMGSEVCDELEANPDKRSQILNIQNQQKVEKVTSKIVSNIEIDAAVNQRADKRKYCEPGPSNFKIPEQALSQKVATQRPISHPRNNSNKENRRNLHHDDDDGQSSTSSIMMMDYADELQNNPKFINTLMERQEEQLRAKRMRMSHPTSKASYQDPKSPSKETFGVNEISSSTPESQPDWLQ